MVTESIRLARRRQADPDSLNALDRPVIVAYLIVVVCLFVTLNLIVDILYKVLDPRVRLEASA